MSTTITKDLADAWFKPKNRVTAAEWEKYDDDQRSAAIAEAIRELSQALASSITDEDVDADDYYYPDRACYEQALHILRRSAVNADGQESGPKFMGVDQAGNPISSPGSYISEDARRWMLWNTGRTVTLWRG